jgi:beta-lactam-binding protein with PASTA domain
VPRVIGLTLKKAKSRIRAKHCGVGKVTRRASSRRVGRVIKQTPKAGAVKPAGFKVKLVVGRR